MNDELKKAVSSIGLAFNELDLDKFLKPASEDIEIRSKFITERIGNSKDGQKILFAYKPLRMAYNVFLDMSPHEQMQTQIWNLEDWYISRIKIARNLITYINDNIELDIDELRDIIDIDKIFKDKKIALDIIDIDNDEVEKLVKVLLMNGELPVNIFDTILFNEYKYLSQIKYNSIYNIVGHYKYLYTINSMNVYGVIITNRFKGYNEIMMLRLPDIAGIEEAIKKELAEVHESLDNKFEKYRVYDNRFSEKYLQTETSFYEINKRIADIDKKLQIVEDMYTRTGCGMIYKDISTKHFKDSDFTEEGIILENNYQFALQLKENTDITVKTFNRENIKAANTFSVKVIKFIKSCFKK